LSGPERLQQGVTATFVSTKGAAGAAIRGLPLGGPEATLGVPGTHT